MHRGRHSEGIWLTWWHIHMLLTLYCSPSYQCPDNSQSMSQDWKWNVRTQAYLIRGETQPKVDQRLLCVLWGWIAGWDGADSLVIISKRMALDLKSHTHLINDLILRSTIIGSRPKHTKGSKECYLLGHNMQIFGVIHFIKLQNNT